MTILKIIYLTVFNFIIIFNYYSEIERVSKETDIKTIEEKLIGFWKSLNFLRANRS